MSLWVGGRTRSVLSGSAGSPSVGPRRDLAPIVVEGRLSGDGDAVASVSTGRHYPRRSSFRVFHPSRTPLSCPLLTVLTLETRCRPSSTTLTGRLVTRPRSSQGRGSSRTSPVPRTSPRRGGESVAPEHPRCPSQYQSLRPRPLNGSPPFSEGDPCPPPCTPHNRGGVGDPQSHPAGGDGTGPQWH